MEIPKRATRESFSCMVSDLWSSSSDRSDLSDQVSRIRWRRLEVA